MLEIGSDHARQAANVVGAVFQVGMTAYAGTRISAVVESGPRSPVEPAFYAFTIWALIFALSLAYAVYQALPANRANPLLRRTGWPTAVAFFCTGGWSIAVPLQQTLLALGVFLVAWACLLAAFGRVIGAQRQLSAGERWLVALPVAVFLGWVTAADLVSIHSELVANGLLAAGSSASVGVGAVLLLVGGGIASAIVAAARAGTAVPQAAWGYGGTVLWALAGIVVNQWGVELVTVAAALLATLPIGIILLRGTPFGPGPPPNGRRADSTARRPSAFRLQNRSERHMHRAPATDVPYIALGPNG